MPQNHPRQPAKNRQFLANRDLDQWGFRSPPRAKKLRPVDDAARQRRHALHLTARQRHHRRSAYSDRPDQFSTSSTLRPASARAILRCFRDRSRSAAPSCAATRVGLKHHAEIA